MASAGSAGCSPRWSRRSTTTAALDLDAAVDAGPLAASTTATTASCVAGTTGEAPTLTDDEKLDLWPGGARGRRRPGRRRHRHATTPRHTVRAHASEAARLGVDGVLVVTPYYNRPSQAGLEAHFRAVGRGHRPAGRCSTTSRSAPAARSPPTLLVRLADDVPNIVGVKDAAGDPGESARLIAERARRLRGLQRRRRR